MKRRVLVLGSAAVALGAALGARTPAGAEVRSARPDVAPRETKPATGGFPLLLVENGGQTDPSVVAYVRGRGMTVHFTDCGVTYALRRGSERWALKATFPGASNAARPELSDEAPTLVSYFKGPKDRWKTGLRTFRTITYRDLWPGIDLVWTAGRDEVKYSFVVRPGADPSRIRVAWSGATGVAVDAAGVLALTTPVAVLRDAAPVSWQDADGRRVPVASAYALDGTTLGFRVGAYDASVPLVVDPAHVLYAGYIGGDGNDVATGVDIDPDGNAFVSGYTDSSAPSFPLEGGPDLTPNGDTDGFVAKVVNGGASLVWIGYIGGDGADAANAIAVDGTHHAYVAGSTLSSAPSFPFVTGPGLTITGEEAFVAKVAANGTSLDWCGTIGGAGTDLATGVVFDGDHDVYVCGNTTSDQTTFPVKTGPILTRESASSGDAFVAKVKSDGTGLVYAGYVGANGQGESATGIDVDGNGAAYVVGITDGAAFPVKGGPGLTPAGGLDGFVAKVKPDGTDFAYSGYVGGSGTDRVNAVAVDVLNRAYVAGTTNSDETTFPVMVGPYLKMKVNTGPPFIKQDAFVARLKADGSAFEYCGYVGGKQEDTGTGIAVNPLGQAFVTGTSLSAAGPFVGNVNGFPAISGPVLTHAASKFAGAYMARVKADGTGFVTSGFVAGLGESKSNAIALGDLGNNYIVGTVKFNAVDFPVLIGPDLTRNDDVNSGLYDAFIAKIASPLANAPIDSYLLPSSVAAKLGSKAKAKTPAPNLAMTGAFDFGTVAPDLTAPSTLDVGGLHFDIPAFVPAGKKFTYAADGLAFTITPNAGGSSKAAFSLKYTGDLTGKVPADGALTVTFADDVATATTTVRLAAGKFKLAAAHGGLEEPGAFVARASAKLVGEGKDSLSLVLGVATDGTTPASPQGVVLTFGGFSRTIAASQFKRKGAKDVFADRKGDVTSVVVDYAKQTVALTGRKLTLDAFPPGPNTVDVTVEIGDGDIRDVRVLMVRKGSALKY